MDIQEREEFTDAVDIEEKGDDEPRSAELETSAAPTKTFEICEEPDLVIQLTTTAKKVIHYRVSRAAMALASPVFRKMVDRGSRMPSLKKRRLEDSSIGEFLDLFDDDPEALLVLLRAIHLRMDLVPADSIGWPELLSIARLVDKYDCLRPLLPWKTKWMNGWVNEALNERGEPWLFLCTVFGESAKFSELTRALIVQHAVPLDLAEREQWFLRGARLVERSKIPDAILATIIERRNEAILKLHAISREFLEQIETSNKKTHDAIKAQANAPSYAFAPPTDPNTCNLDCMGTCYGNYILRLQICNAWRFLKLDVIAARATLSDPKGTIFTGTPTILRDVVVEALNKAFEACTLGKHPGGPPTWDPSRKADVYKCGLKNLIEETVKDAKLVIDNIVGLDSASFTRYHAKPAATWEKM